MKHDNEELNRKIDAAIAHLEALRDQKRDRRSVDQQQENERRDGIDRRGAAKE
ncbi:MAG: hypothetical protein V4641_00965 [Pseudomonadota bacterium]